MSENEKDQLNEKELAEDYGFTAGHAKMTEQLVEAMMPYAVLSRRAPITITIDEAEWLLSKPPPPPPKPKPKYANNKHNRILGVSKR